MNILNIKRSAIAKVVLLPAYFNLTAAFAEITALPAVSNAREGCETAGHATVSRGTHGLRTPSEYPSQSFNPFFKL